MIYAQIDNNGNILINIKSKDDLKIKAGEQLKKEYCGIIASIIKIMRKNDIDDETIEKMLVEAIMQGFEGMEDAWELSQQ